jgi:microcystin-dependent protein
LRSSKRLEAAHTNDFGRLDMEPFIGELRLVPFNFAPKGWALCAGQLLPINQNQALFALLGTTYGGDGRTTFALPDLRGRIAVGAGQLPGGSDYPLGAAGGQETVRLTTSQLPGHAHAVHASSAAGTTKNPATAYPAGGGSYAAAKNVRMKAGMIGQTGGGEEHENRPPYLSLNYVIALQGIFPAQS